MPNRTFRHKAFNHKLCRRPAFIVLLQTLHCRALLCTSIRILLELPWRNTLRVKPIHFISGESFQIWDEEEAANEQQNRATHEDKSGTRTQIARVGVVHIWHGECEEPGDEGIRNDTEGLSLETEAQGRYFGGDDPCDGCHGQNLPGDESVPDGKILVPRHSNVAARVRKLTSRWRYPISCHGWRNNTDH